MRTIVAIVALAALLAATPLGAGAPPNECTSSGMQVCVPVDLSSAHQNLPGLSSLPYFDVFYVWFGPNQCTANPLADACNGQSSGQDGIPLPTSGTVPITGQFGMVYQETNGAGGLQRLGVASGGHFYFPDRMVLV